MNSISCCPVPVETDSTSCDSFEFRRQSSGGLTGSESIADTPPACGGRSPRKVNYLYSDERAIFPFSSNMTPFYLREPIKIGGVLIEFLLCDCSPAIFINNQFFHSFQDLSKHFIFLQYPNAEIESIKKILAPKRCQQLMRSQ